MNIQKVDLKCLDGEVMKFGGGKKRCSLSIWKRRFFVLTNKGILYTFKNSSKPTKKEGLLIKDQNFRRTFVKKYAIQIEKRFDESHVFIDFESSPQCLDWMLSFSKAGGIIQNRDNENKGRLERHVKQWSVNDVYEFLEYCCVGSINVQELYGELFKKNKVNGKKLLKLVEDDLKKMGITNLPHRKRIMRTLKNIKYSENYFDINQRIVLRKIESSSKIGDFKKMDYLAQCLSNPSLMMNTYLNPHEIKDFEYLQEFVDDENNTKESDFFEGKDGGGQKVNLKLLPKKKFKLPVKLVVTEISHSKNEKRARRFFSPIMSKIPYVKESFGYFHTALIIGPWYIEWNSSSLCVPRKLFSGMAIISADIDTKTLLKDCTIFEVTEKLAEVICYWNVNKTYSKLSSKGKKFGNCQGFVEHVFEKLSISPYKTENTDDEFLTYLREMRIKGECEMVFTPSKKFKETFKIKENKIKFETHKELDEFVKRLLDIDEIEFMMHCRGAKKILKSFDRALWLKHYKFPDNEKFKPCKDCPFDNPQKTKSYM